MDYAQAGLFVLAVLILNLTPGPDMMFSAVSGMRNGARAGLISALGIGVGGLVHATLAAVGVTALIASSDIAYHALRVAGALYLLWLGISAFFEKSAADQAEIPQNLTARGLFFKGFVTNVLNPKVGLFFIAFLPQFIDPSSDQLALQVFLMGCFVSFSGTIINGTAGLIAGRAGQWASGNPRIRKTISRVSGGVLMGLGVRLLFLERG